jgi:tetratricopeptide (TPR) repeat protein
MKARSKSSRWLYLLISVAVLGVLALGAGIWYVRRPPPPHEPPVVDLSDADPEVAQAITEARDETVRAPRSGAAWGRLGMLLLAHNYFADAGTVLAEAERLDPNDPRWPYLQALVFHRIEPEREVPKLRRALELSPEPTVRLGLAEALLAQGQLDEAEALFQQAEKADRESARAQVGLAQVAEARGNLAISLDRLQRAAHLPGTRPHTVHALLAEVYTQMGKYTQAERERQQVARLPPDPAWPDPFAREPLEMRVGRRARIDRANHLRRSGQLGEAISLLQETTLLYEDFDAGWLALGGALLQAGNYPEAERAFRRAAACVPPRSEAQYGLGLALYLQRDQGHETLRRAAQAFREAARLAPLMSSARLYLGMCLQELGDPAGAVAAYQAALDSGPDSSEAHRRLGEQLVELARQWTALATLGRLVGCSALLDGAAVARADGLAHLRSAARLAPKDTAARRALDAVGPHAPSSDGK